MKVNNLLKVAMLAALPLLWSCTTEEPIPDLTENGLEQVSNNSMLATNVLTNRLTGQGYNGPNAFIFGKFYNDAAGRTQISSPLQMITQLRGKNSAAARSAQDACYTESFTEFEDGSYEYILDFGEGCEFYGEFMKGKLVETGSYDDSTFQDKIEYMAFGGVDWEISGIEEYEGSYTEDDINEDIWSVSYEFSTDLTEKFIDFGYEEDEEVSTGEELIELTYVASGSETMDESSFTVINASTSVVVSTGEEFTSDADTLFMDFNCDEDDVWIFVSGTESGTYSFPTEDGSDGIISGTYSIDYGNGTCDNIVTITENGISEDVDLGEEWDDWEEECDDHEDWDEEDEEDEEDQG